MVRCSLFFDARGGRERGEEREERGERGERIEEREERSKVPFVVGLVPRFYLHP